MQSKNCQERLLPPHRSNTRLGSLGTRAQRHVLLCMCMVRGGNFYFTIIFIHSFFHFPTQLFQFKVVGDQSLSQQLSVQGRDPPWTGRPPITGHTHLTHTLRLRPDTNKPHLHIFGAWEETSAQKTLRPGGRPDCTQTVAPAGNQFFSQCYNKMTLNKMMLFKDLLCVRWCMRAFSGKKRGYLSSDS